MHSLLSDPCCHIPCNAHTLAHTFHCQHSTYPACMLASIFHNASCTSVRYGPWFHLCGAMVALLSVLEWNNCGSMSLTCQSQTDAVFTCRRGLQWSIWKPRRHRKVQINAAVFLILHADVHCELDFDSSSSFTMKLGLLSSISWCDKVRGFNQWLIFTQANVIYGSPFASSLTNHLCSVLIDECDERVFKCVRKVRLGGKSLNYTEMCFHFCETFVFCVKGCHFVRFCWNTLFCSKIFECFTKVWL